MIETWYTETATIIKGILDYEAEYKNNEKDKTEKYNSTMNNKNKRNLLQLIKPVNNK